MRLTPNVSGLFAFPSRVITPLERSIAGSPTSTWMILPLMGMETLCHNSRLQQCVRVAPDGEITTIAKAEQGVADSTALAFGRTAADQASLYVTPLMAVCHYRCQQA